MTADTVKVKNIKTGVIKEVSKSIAGDFIGTNEFVIYEEKKSPDFLKEKDKDK